MAMPPTPSPRTLMSSFLNEDFSSGQFSNFFGEHVSNKPHDQSEKRGELVDLREQVPTQSATATPQKDFSLQPNSFNANQKSNPQGSLAERRASRAGFSIPKIDTSRVGSSTVIRSPIAIPPGLSPTTLLESPVFLYNAMVCHLLITGFLLCYATNNYFLHPGLIGRRATETFPFLQVRWTWAFALPSIPLCAISDFNTINCESLAYVLIKTDHCTCG